MNESKFGKNDSRGNWSPDAKISYGPFFSWPPQLASIIKWMFGFPGYFLPWNVLYAVVAILIWQFLTPSLETFSANMSYWIAAILLRNIVLAVLVYGGCLLYTSPSPRDRQKSRMPSSA